MNAIFSIITTTDALTGKPRIEDMNYVAFSGNHVQVKERTDDKIVFNIITTEICLGL
jgi:hypothetical protein